MCEKYKLAQQQQQQPITKTAVKRSRIHQSMAAEYGLIKPFQNFRDNSWQKEPPMAYLTKMCSEAKYSGSCETGASFMYFH